MKKFIFSLGLILSQTILLRASNVDSIPNSGFERWNFISWYLNPAGWGTNNTSLLAATVVQDSNSYSGLLAMQLLNSGSLVPEASVGFKIQQHPISLSGFVRNDILTNDSAYVIVRLYRQNQPVDSGSFTFYGGINPFYHSFIIPISQNSSNTDSCEIRMYGGQQYLSSISFDDLSLTQSSNIGSTSDDNKFKIYPNPFSSYIRVEFSEPIDEDAYIEIYDINGKLVAGKNLLNNIIAVYTQKNGTTLLIEQEALAPGVYSLVVNTSGKRYSKKIIRN